MMSSRSSRRVLVVALVLAVLAVGAMQAAAGYTETQKLTTSDGAASDRFGSAAGIDGNVAVFGAPYDDEGAVADCGAAYVYTWDGTWTQRSKLATDMGSNAQFGDAVAISGDTIVVGAYNKNWGVLGGAVYVFVWDGDSWATEARLTAPDAAYMDYFGHEVDISGDTIAVGARLDDDMGGDSGSVYVFTRTGSTWTLQQKLTASDGATADLFGQDVDVQADTLVVGAPGRDDLGSSSGAAYVYTRIAGSWSEQAKLTAADAAATDSFGYAVALDGDTAVIGAAGDDTPGMPTISNHGSAYVFTRSGVSWTQQAKLTAPSGAAGDNLGEYVALDGDMAVLSAPYDDTLGNSAGAAYVFSRTGNVWSLQKKLTASDGVASDYYGFGGLAVQGSALFVGAPYDDNANGSDAGAVYHTHAEANTAPQAVGDFAMTDEDTPISFGAPGVLANDVDVDSDTLEAVKLTDPNHGEVTFSADGAFTYTPEQDFNGTDAFAYRASDGTTYSAPATVTVMVSAINDAPIAHDDTRTAHMDAGLVVSAPGVLANDVDVDDDLLSAVRVTDPDHGTLSLGADGSYLYTPDPGYSGPDQFTYQADDGMTSSGVATVHLLVDPANDAPVGATDAYVVGEDETLTVTAPGVLANDTDAESDPITAELSSGPFFGTVSLAADGSFTYRAPEGMSGTDAFWYVADDGAAESTPTAVTIEIQPVNDPPVARDDSYNTVEDAIIEIAAPGLLANDSDVESATLVIWDRAGALDPQHGTLSLTQDGWFRYRPDASWSGTDTFTYRCYDGALYSNYATVTVAVANVNDPPAAYNDSYDATEDTTLVVAAPGVLANDSDPESATLTATRTGAEVDPQHGTVDFAADGSFVYVPAPNFHGTDTFGYFASDGGEVSYEGYVTIDVASVNDAPSFTAGANVSHQRSAGPYSAAWATSVTPGPLESEAVSFSVEVEDEELFSAGPQVASNGVMSFTFAADAFGSTDATVTMSDALGLSATPARLTITATVADTVAPTTTATFDPAGWTNGDVTVTLEPVDTGSPESSGVQVTRYRIGGGLVTDYSAPFSVTASTPIDVEYWSVDRNGNTEMHKFGRVYADRYAPITHRDGLLQDEIVVADATKTVTFEPEDGNDSSGVARTDWAVIRASDGSVTASGQGLTAAFRPSASVPASYALHYASTDGAGNRETTRVAAFTVIPSDVPGVVTRLSGSDRFAVAAAMARKGWDPTGTKAWPGVDYVIIANGETGKEADPLAAAGLSGAFNAPLLLVQTTGIPKATKDVVTEIAGRRKAQGRMLVVIIVGGTASVPDTLRTQLQAVPGVFTSVARIAGADRYAVSAEIARKVVARSGAGNVNGVILVAADNPAAFYDALAASPISAKARMPMLSVKKGSVPSSVASVLAKELAGKPRYAASSATYIGPAALAGATRMTTSSNRFTAASDIAKFATGKGWLAVTDVGMAAKLPDSLGGGAFLGKRGGVLLFTDSTSAIQPATKAYIAANAKKVDFGWVLGGTASVPAGQESTFKTMIK